MRTIAGIIAGLVIGFVVTIIVGIVGVGMTFSVPEGINLSDSREVVDAFGTMPQGAKLALMLAWFAGGLSGALVAKLIARSAWAAWIVAALIAAYVVLNTFVLPLPAWMQVLSIAAPLIGGLIANHLVGDRAAAPAEGEAEAPAYDPADD